MLCCLYLWLPLPLRLLKRHTKPSQLKSSQIKPTSRRACVEPQNDAGAERKRWNEILRRLWFPFRNTQRLKVSSDSGDNGGRTGSAAYNSIKFDCALHFTYTHTHTHKHTHWKAIFITPMRVRCLCAAICAPSEKVTFVNSWIKEEKHICKSNKKKKKTIKIGGSDGDGARRTEYAWKTSVVCHIWQAVSQWVSESSVCERTSMEDQGMSGLHKRRKC